jgi:tetratricopeptide (TPR) repeat protein
MLSGDLPYQGSTPWAVVNQHLAAPHPPLEDICPDLPPSVIRLVDKAMAKRPEDRYQTPAEMAEAIGVLLADTDLSDAGPVPTPVAPERLEELYQQARSAAELGSWQEAISYFSQIVHLDPDYRDVAEQITVAGEQLRISALYDSARRALQLGQWDHALSQLDIIAESDPEYRDIETLRAMAERKEVLTDGIGTAPGEYQTQVDLMAWGSCRLTRRWESGERPSAAKQHSLQRRAAWTAGCF